MPFHSKSTFIKSRCGLKIASAFFIDLTIGPFNRIFTINDE